MLVPMGALGCLIEKIVAGWRSKIQFVRRSDWRGRLTDYLPPSLSQAWLAWPGLVWGQQARLNS